MPTIDDVARMAKVSKGTVSSVFSKKRPISKEVSDRVLEAAKQLNYKPNFLARSLANKETRIIGLVMRGEKTNLSQFHMSLINGVLQECYGRGYRLLINLMSAEYMNRVENQASDPVDGEILLDPRVEDPRIIERLKLEQPLVVIGRPPQAYEPRVSYVNNDNEGLACEITEYLLGLGHRRILFLNAAAYSTVAEDRESGYLRAFRQQGKTVEVGDIVSNDQSLTKREFGYEQTLTLLSRHQCYTAIIADTVTVALGVYQAAHELQLRIPDQLSVFAFSDDSVFSPALQPPLSGVRLNPDRLGEEAARLLLEQCSQAHRPAKRVVVAAELVYRDSCAAPMQVGKL
jgi:DNA-binding LacI/PurR family transcriptional regulator